MKQQDPMQKSLCETCAFMREIVTPKGSRFLLCQLSLTDAAYPKYPRQPVAHCEAYRAKQQPPPEQLSFTSL
jgi:hypothetical protein